MIFKAFIVLFVLVLGTQEHLACTNNLFKGGSEVRSFIGVAGFGAWGGGGADRKIGGVKGFNLGQILDKLPKGSLTAVPSFCGYSGEGIEQRTPEWFAKRNEKITGSVAYLAIVQPRAARG